VGEDRGVMVVVVVRLLLFRLGEYHESLSHVSCCDGSPLLCFQELSRNDRELDAHFGSLSKTC
jgi:hypothetical protein